MVEVQKIMQACWEAAPLNPGWGDRETVTLKLASSYYNESGCVPNTKCYNAWNKSWDIGIAQINTIHQGRTFKKFCQAQGLTWTPSLIWDLKVNVAFGAFINQIQIEHHGRTYLWKNLKKRSSVVVWNWLARTPAIVKGIEKGTKP